MWESPIYTFEKETTGKNGKIVKVKFHINTTYSTPRNLEGPGDALIGVFNKITERMTPSKTNVLDFGAGKLRNTLWLLQKGFHVWAVEFPELKDRLEDAKTKWDMADRYTNFHRVTFPKDFIKLKKKSFDIIILVNVFNVMPIPLERFALLTLCREKIRNKGKLLWHQWRGLAIGGDSYSEENAFLDGYLRGGPNYTFYVEHNREQSHEILYSTGFVFNKDMNLHKIKANTCYSYVFNPKHEPLISNALQVKSLLRKKNNPKKAFVNITLVNVLDLYTDELKKTQTGRDNAYKYHLLASRIFFEIFRNQLGEPNIEREINTGRGRIDFTCRNLNKEGVFKNLKEMRDIKCPEIMVECKNYDSDLANDEFQQLNDRLIPHRGVLGFLICRDKKDKEKILEHCKDRYKGGNNKYIIVLDDEDLITLAEHKQNGEEEDAINEFVEDKIKEIID